MSTTNKVCKMIHCRSGLRQNTSKRLFSSTSASQSSPERQIASLSKGERKTRNSKLKRPLSSVAVYHHYDNDQYDAMNTRIEFDNFLNNVKRNSDKIPDNAATQQSRSELYMDLNSSRISKTEGRCCYTMETKPRFPCGSNHHEDEVSELPPPLEEPKYSVHKRVLPADLTAFSSKEGKRYLMEAFSEGTAESYWKLTEHFVNQSDPAFCGVTTLLMCLNAMCIDPNVRWRGGWRFYGSEDVLLDRCCFSAERIRRKGIVLEDFAKLGRCHGLSIDLKRPPFESDSQDEIHAGSSNNNGEAASFSIDDFRRDIRWILSGTEANHQPLLVTSFSRSALGQTGDGHFSPIAAYHEESDQVLVLDVARFKYAPYWVRVEDLYQSMRSPDPDTGKPRGWFLLSPPKNHECLHEHGIEDRRPVDTVPKLGEPELCPIGDIKVEFCKGN